MECGFDGEGGRRGEERGGSTSLSVVCRKVQELELPRIKYTPPSVKTTARGPGTLSVLQLEATGQKGSFPHAFDL